MAALFAAALCLTARPHAGWADTPAQTAAELHAAALAAQQSKRYEECYAKAKAAWEAQPQPVVAATLGECALALDRPREAAEHLAFFLERAPADTPAERLSYVRGRLDGAKLSLATVTLSAGVPGAQVTVDGELVESVPVTRYLEPGEHTFRAELRGYRPAVVTRRLGAGSEERIDLELRPEQGDRIHPGIAGALGGATGLALVVGVVLAVLAADKGSEADDQLTELEQAEGPTPCPEDSGSPACYRQYELRGEEDSLLNARNAALIIFGAAAAATAAYLVISFTINDGDDGGATTASLVPALGGAAFSLSW